MVGVIIVYGVKLNLDSDDAENIIEKLMMKNESIPRPDNFSEYYDHYVLGNENPNIESLLGEQEERNLENYFYDVFYDCDWISNRNIKCFRQPCCLSGRDKIIIGVKLDHIGSLDESPQHSDLPIIDDDLISSVQSQLISYGLNTNMKTYFILDDCTKCT